MYEGRKWEKVSQGIRDDDSHNQKGSTQTVFSSCVCSKSLNLASELRYFRGVQRAQTNFL